MLEALFWAILVIATFAVLSGAWFLLFMRTHAPKASPSAHRAPVIPIDSYRAPPATTSRRIR